MWASKTVLLAEDEDSLRRLLVSTLEGLGVNLIVGVNGVDALQKARQHEGKIDVLITNVQMPDMNGSELARHLCGDRPDIKVLFMSGFTGEPIMITDGWRFLQKPFTPIDFAATVRAMLHRVQEHAESLNQPDYNSPEL